MSHSGIALSARSYLIAGVSAAVVGAAAVNPVSVPALNPARSAAAAVELSAISAPIEIAIKNTYDFVEPWVAWGAELSQYVLSFIPGLWWVAPAIDLAYFTIEPLVQAGVYTFADVIGLNFSQIWPDITAGIGASINNAVAYGLAWLNSLVPLPPLPPFPPFPGASVAAPAASVTGAGLLAAPAASSITTPVEIAIKNGYNFVQGWTNYATQWADYVLGRIPVVKWFAPAIPLVYNTIEPLLRAGVYSVADLIGLNFGAIGPDIWTGITTSVNNAIQGVLNWGNIPVPPVPPLRAASVAASAASLRAAAAVPAAATAETVVEADSAAVETEAPAAPGTETAGPKAEAAEVNAPEAPETVVSEVAAPTAETTDPAAEPSAPSAEAPAADETPRPARTGRRGHSAPAGAEATDGSSVKSERPGRTTRARSHAG